MSMVSNSFFRCDYVVEMEESSRTRTLIGPCRPVSALASDNFAHLKNDPTGMYLAQSAKFAGAVELQRAMIEVRGT